MRAGEFTIPDDSSFDPSVHLCWGDLAVDNPIDPAILSVTLKASKTDPFRRSITLYIGRVASDLCPVSAVLAYLVARGKRPGPLFMFKDGRPLTRQRLVSAVCDALERAGVEVDKYAGHSSESGLLPPPPREVWWILPFRRWVDGVVHSDSETPVGQLLC